MEPQAAIPVPAFSSVVVPPTHQVQKAATPPAPSVIEDPQKGHSKALSQEYRVETDVSTPVSPEEQQRFREPEGISVSNLVNQEVVSSEEEAELPY